MGCQACSSLSYPSFEYSLNPEACCSFEYSLIILESVIEMIKPSGLDKLPIILYYH